MKESFRGNIRNISGALVNLVLPPRCIVSGQEVDRQGMLAPEIWAGLDFIAAPYCNICCIPFEFDTATGTELCASCIQKAPDYNRARSALKYNDASRPLILGFKHADQTHAVLAFMPWMKASGVEFISGAHKADILIPVPLHPLRLLARRYNQAALLAHKFSKETGIPVFLDGLKRVRHTPSQGHLNAGERAKNVKKAFAVTPRYIEQIKGKNILLIDDVYTTGSTVNECARALKKAGAFEVNVLCIARVVKEG